MLKKVTACIIENVRLVPAGSLDKLPLVIENPALAHFVDNLQAIVLGLREQDGGPVDVRLPLHGVLVLQVESRNLQVGLELVVNAVLLLSCFERNSHKNLCRWRKSHLMNNGCETNYPCSLTPILLSLINVGQMLSDATNLS